MVDEVRLVVQVMLKPSFSSAQFLVEVGATRRTPAALLPLPVCHKLDVPILRESGDIQHDDISHHQFDLIVHMC